MTTHSGGIGFLGRMGVNSPATTGLLPAKTDGTARLASFVLKFARALGALIVAALLGTYVAHAQILVTAVRDGGGNLKLISWNENGERLNGDGAQAGEVSLISAVRLGTSNQMVTAVEDGAGNLKVIVWRVSTNGQIERRQSGQAGEADRIGVAANPSGDRLVTAVRDGGRRLKVILWAVSPEGGISRLGHGPLEHDIVYPVVTGISTTFVGTSGTMLATAMSDLFGNLKIVTWRITTFGCVTKLKEASAGEVSEISMTAHDGGRLITAVRDGGNNLKLIAWNVDQEGNIVRAQEAQAGTASRISAFPLFGSRLATAVRDGRDDLKVIVWDSSPNNNTIERVAEASAGDISRIAGCATGVGPNPPQVVKFQTSVRDGGDNLKIIPWRWNPSTTVINRFSGGEASAGEVSLISTVCF
jgi:hypothetical protein